MSRAKRRSSSNIIGEQGERLLRHILPAHWVIHEYKPDYGIDYVVEVFDYVEEKVAETLGELFFVQLKTVEKVEKETITVYNRGNVEKAPLTEGNKQDTVDVFKIQLETSELKTVQLMGAANPVLLVLAVLETESVYFVCLNDFLDKVIIPADPKWFEKAEKTIHIPAVNKVDKKSEIAELWPLMFYAKRSKLHAGFIKFVYQHHELRMSVERGDSAEELSKLMLHFANILLDLYVWDAHPILKDHRKDLAVVQAYLSEPPVMPYAEED